MLNVRFSQEMSGNSYVDIFVRQEGIEAVLTCLYWDLLEGELPDTCMLCDASESLKVCRHLALQYKARSKSVCVCRSMNKSPLLFWSLQPHEGLVKFYTSVQEAWAKVRVKCGAACCPSRVSTQDVFKLSSLWHFPPRLHLRSKWAERILCTHLCLIWTQSRVDV